MRAYVFGAFLILTGVKMLMTLNEVPALSGNRVTRFMRRHFRVTEGCEGERFLVRQNGVRLITPLFIVLVLGAKMVVNAALGPVIPTEWALLTTAGIIGGSVWLSVHRTRGLPAEAAATVMPRGWAPGSLPKAEGPGTDKK